MQTFVEAPGPIGVLKGTMLSAARGPAGPVVLIIPGSGPTDRDGDSPLGVRAAPYRLLAEALASRGLTSVRIDKRGLFASAAAVPNPNAVTIADYVNDVRSWVASIRHTTGARCVWLLGHSEGGLVALASSAVVGDLCGVVVVSAAGRSLGQVLQEQILSNPANAPVLAQAKRAIAELSAGRRVDVSGFHPALLQLFAPAVQDFEIDAFKRDPAKLASELKLPLLIVQGQADLQVGVDDARRLKLANSAARLVIVPGMNHVLKSASLEDRSANIATYADPNLPLAPGVATVIADFIASHSSPG